MPAAKKKKSAPAKKKAKPKGGPKPSAADPNGTVAITGLNRFVGTETLRWLVSDPKRKVIGLDIRKPPGEWPSNFTFYKIDLTDPTADQAILDIFREEKVQTVVHAAFHHSPQYDSTQAHELESIGTMQLLHACAEYRIRKLLFTSSTMVYGARPENPTYIPEESRMSGRKSYHYVWDKIDAEKTVFRYRKVHPECIVTVLRLANLIGPRGDHFFNHILSMSAVPRVLGFDPLMQLLHEDDAVDAVKKAFREEHDGVYNIVPPDVLPFSTIIRLSGKLPLPLPSSLLESMTGVLWIAQMGKIPPGHRDYLKYLCVACGDRMRDEFGFEPRYSTRQALDSFLGVHRLRRFKPADQPVG